MVVYMITYLSNDSGERLSTGGNRTPKEVYYRLNGKVNHNYLAAGRELISSPVPITNAVLSQEVVQGAPSGHTQEIIHLNKPLILS